MLSNMDSRKADKAHPLGFGRLEYLSSMVVTLLVMYTGVRAIISSVKDIICPDGAPDYNAAAVIILLASIACKIGYGLLLRNGGKRLNSISMIMTGTDGMGDAQKNRDDVLRLLQEDLEQIFPEMTFEIHESSDI